MRAWFVTALVAALTCAAALPAAAQRPPLPLQIEEFDHRGYPEVVLTVSMPPQLTGADIPASSFEVTENGEPIEATITRVSTENLRVVVLIDTSGSMSGSPMDAARTAAEAFVSLMPTGVELALVAFGEQAEVVSPFTTDRAATAVAIQELEARGETALYDGLIAATELFPVEENSRQVVVMLSDGGDTVSQGTLEDAIVALLGAEVRFFAVELQSPENDPEPLQRLGTATDGRVVPVEDHAAFAGIFDDIAVAIVNQYRIEFQASAFGSTEVGVTVTHNGITTGLRRLVRFPAEPRGATATVPTTAVAPAPAPTFAPRPGVETTADWFATEDAKLIGLATLFLGLALLLFFLMRQGGRVSTAAGEARSMMRTKKESLLAGMTRQAAGLADRTLDKRGGKGRMDAMLEAAGVGLRAGEFLLFLLGASFGGYAAGHLLGAPLLGVLLAAIVAAVIYAWLARKRLVRRRAFAEQLPATLQLLSGSLRAGFGLMQAIQVVIEESPSPTAEEFHRVKVESQLGRDLDESLAAAATRVGSEDFEWVIEGIQIHREVGGDLSQILDRVAETIRDQTRLRRQVKALSAEGRMSAAVLIVIPIALAVLINFTNPAYLNELTGNVGGRIALGSGGVLMVAGVFWIRRLVTFDY